MPTVQGSFIAMLLPRVFALLATVCILYILMDILHQIAMLAGVSGHVWTGAIRIVRERAPAQRQQIRPLLEEHHDRSTKIQASHANNSARGSPRSATKRTRHYALPRTSGVSESERNVHATAGVVMPPFPAGQDIDIFALSR